MKTLTAALAMLALAAPAVAQEDQPAGGGRGHAPQLGKPAARTTGASAKSINRASGGGVRHGPRGGSGKVKRTAAGAQPTAR